MQSTCNLQTHTHTNTHTQGRKEGRKGGRKDKIKAFRFLKNIASVYLTKKIPKGCILGRRKLISDKKSEIEERTGTMTLLSCKEI